jgi:hypothetical protein
MENREAINWLTRIRDRLMTTSSKQFEAMTIAIAAIEQQEKAFDEWCTDCKEYDKDRHCCPRFSRVIRGAVDEVKQQGWVPVSERLPEKDKCYTVTVKNEGLSPYVDECYWNGDDKVFERWDDYSDTLIQVPNVIAWKPITEAYREDKT